MKTALANALRRLWTIAPRSPKLFRLCRMYVNFHEGDDNPAIDSNGEATLMRQLLPQCAIAFDVGAHRGDWARRALAINSQLIVHCFEPSSVTFPTLSHRFRANPHKILCNRCALSDVPGTAMLHLHDASPDVNSLHPSDPAGIAPQTATESVQIQTLDDYCCLHAIAAIDYLKIDVEGHEWSVLQGGRRRLGKHAIRFLQIEYGPGYLQSGKRLSDIFAMLTPLGYRAHKITPKGVICRTYSPELETFKLSNWLFTEKEMHARQRRIP